MLTKENESKVYILYMINLAGCGLAYDDIFGMAQETGLDYFDFSVVFSKLVQENNLRGADALYHITERGRAIAENLAHLVPTALKSKCAAAVARMLELNKLGADFYAEITPENGGHKFVCGIKSKNSEIFSISLSVKERAAAENMRAVFNERPAYIYRAVLALLSGDPGFIGP